jgi:hypothetical protein
MQFVPKRRVFFFGVGEAQLAPPSTLGDLNDNGLPRPGRKVALVNLTQVKSHIRSGRLRWRLLCPGYPIETTSSICCILCMSISHVDQALRLLEAYRAELEEARNVVGISAETHRAVTELLTSANANIRSIRSIVDSIKR